METEIRAMREELGALRADVRLLLARDSERRGASKAVKTLYGIGVAALSVAVSLFVAWWRR